MAIKKGKAMVVFSTKGGVGKTFFTINLAGVYSFLKKRVLIIDLDLFSGGIALALDINQKKDVYTLVDDLNNNRYTKFNDYVIKYNEEIDILPCPKDPRLGSKIEKKYIEIIMAQAIDNYDVVLFDTSHSFNDINLTVLDKADNIILLLTNDPIGVKNMKSLISIFRDTEKANYITILNNATRKNKDIFSLFDIKNIIRNNVDWIISNAFYFKDIDRWLIRGEIPLLNKKIQRSRKLDFERYKKIALNLIKEEKGIFKNE